MRTLCLSLLFALCWHSGVAGDSLHIVSGVYRMTAGERNGLKIWIVDGATIRRDLYHEFLYGGNGQRYRFVPSDEIWVDNAIAADEFQYTVAHEIHERSLMAKKGLTYAEAHDSALAVERAIRLADKRLAHHHEEILPKISPTDCDGVKEIDDLPDSLRLLNVYRTMLGVREGIIVWIVDGAVVRRDIFPDFGLSGNDRAYHFIPKGEIWIDGQISCEETEFSIETELLERRLMVAGTSYDDAYEQALARVLALRTREAKAAAGKPGVVVPEKLDRDVGTGDE